MKPIWREGYEIREHYLKGIAEIAIRSGEDPIEAGDKAKLSPEFLQLELLIDIRSALDSVRTELEALREQLKD